MKKPKLKDGQVFSVRLKDGSFALAQFITGSHVAFFKAFSDTDEWEDDSAETSELLFICVVMMQFFEYSIVNVLENVRPRVFASLPAFLDRAVPRRKESRRLARDEGRADNCATEPAAGRSYRRAAHWPRDPKAYCRQIRLS
jgi:hypothetical protein